jgi:hypothetical protein
MLNLRLLEQIIDRLIKKLEQIIIVGVKSINTKKTVHQNKQYLDNGN